MPLVNKILRDADPDTCRRIDELRLERKPLWERFSYLQNAGSHIATAASEAAGIAQKVAELDQKIADLHAKAKAAAAKARSAELRIASAIISDTKNESEQLLGEMRSESSRHTTAMSSLISKHIKLNTQYDVAAGRVATIADAEDSDAANDDKGEPPPCQRQCRG